jgi:hypothetical protein
VSLSVLAAIARLDEDAAADGVLKLQSAGFLYETQLVPVHPAHGFRNPITFGASFGNRMAELLEQAAAEIDRLRADLAATKSELAITGMLFDGLKASFDTMQSERTAALARAEKAEAETCAANARVDSIRDQIVKTAGMLDAAIVRAEKAEKRRVRS